MHMTAESSNRAEIFDPSGDVPPRIAALLDETGGPPAVAVLTTGAADLGWSAACAFRLADALTERGRPAVLVDLFAENPALNTRLGLPNVEGITDVLLYGSSLERVVQVVDGHAFGFISTGPAVADGGAVLQNEAWPRIMERLRAMERTAVLYLPAAAPGALQLAQSCGLALVLVSGETEAEAVDVPVGVPARVLAPPATPASVTGEVAGTSEVRASAVRTEQKTSQRKRRRWIALAVLVVILLGVVAFLAWRSSIRAAAAGPPPSAPSAAAAAAPGAGQPAGEPLTYSVVVESRPSLSSALDRSHSLSSSGPGPGFFVSPITVGGAVYFRVMAGPVADSGSAAALLQQLVASGAKSAADGWSVRHTPLSFLFGEFATRAEATQRQGELLAKGIPSYVVELPYTSGSVAYRVYGGAFEDSAVAATLGSMLRGAGVQADLVQRIGRPHA
jgi:hypothetical protein